MKSSILLLPILGMIAINVVTGGPIEDAKQENSSENNNRNADISGIDLQSRRKRPNDDCTDESENCSSDLIPVWGCNNDYVKKVCKWSCDLCSHRFVHTDKGAKCSDNGFVDLSTAQECSAALNYAMSFNSEAIYDREDSWSDYPTGCIILDDGVMYFNTHSTGGRGSGVASICKKDLWIEEAPSMRCGSPIGTASVTNQKECQEKCVQDSECIGIIYSHKTGYGGVCGICKDDEMKSSYNNFGFYRRPASYELTQSSVRDCSDVGKMALSDEGECKKAASALFIRYHDGGSWSHNPKGCSCLSNSFVIWNDHQTGSNRADSKAICRSDGKNTTG